MAFVWLMWTRRWLLSLRPMHQCSKHYYSNIWCCGTASDVFVLDCLFFLRTEGFFLGSLWLYDQSHSLNKELPHILMMQLLYVASNFELKLLQYWYILLMRKKNTVRCWCACNMWVNVSEWVDQWKVQPRLALAKLGKTPLVAIHPHVMGQGVSCSHP